MRRSESKPRCTLLKHSITNEKIPCRRRSASRTRLAYVEQSGLGTASVGLLYTDCSCKGDGRDSGAVGMGGDAPWRAQGESMFQTRPRAVRDPILRDGRNLVRRAQCDNGRAVVRVAEIRVEHGEKRSCRRCVEAMSSMQGKWVVALDKRCCCGLTYNRVCRPDPRQLHTPDMTGDGKAKADQDQCPRFGLGRACSAWRLAVRLARASDAAKRVSNSVALLKSMHINPSGPAS